MWGLVFINWGGRGSWRWDVLGGRAKAYGNFRMFFVKTTRGKEENRCVEHGLPLRG